ncbi:MAG: FeoB-associated Cys-rich membrane protein [Pseudomonadota bacterium]|nr:FeoB-associated Cys-rich membrane protein [Pseudomonadota bacterium]
MELIIVGLIVILALFSIGRHVYNSAQSAHCGNSGDACGGCSNSNEQNFLYTTKSTKKNCDK